MFSIVFSLCLHAGGLSATGFSGGGRGWLRMSGVAHCLARAFRTPGGRTLGRQPVLLSQPQPGSSLQARRGTGTVQINLVLVLALTGARAQEILHGGGRQKFTAG